MNYKYPLLILEIIPPWCILFDSPYNQAQKSVIKNCALSHHQQIYQYLAVTKYVNMHCLSTSSIQSIYQCDKTFLYRITKVFIINKVLFILYDYIQIFMVEGTLSFFVIEKYLLLKNRYSMSSFLKPFSLHNFDTKSKQITSSNIFCFTYNLSAQTQFLISIFEIWISFSSISHSQFQSK